jgi:hypothetical protein
MPQSQRNPRGLQFMGYIVHGEAVGLVKIFRLSAIRGFGRLNGQLFALCLVLGVQDPSNFQWHWSVSAY